MFKSIIKLISVHINFLHLNIFLVTECFDQKKINVQTFFSTKSYTKDDI